MSGSGEISALLLRKESRAEREVEAKEQRVCLMSILPLLHHYSTIIPPPSPSYTHAHSFHSLCFVSRWLGNVPTTHVLKNNHLFMPIQWFLPKWFGNDKGHLDLVVRDHHKNKTILSPNCWHKWVHTQSATSCSSFSNSMLVKRWKREVPKSCLSECNILLMC